MPVTARGKVYLDSVQFTTDPQDYAPAKWPKRASYHPGLGGSMTIQDFGRYAKDCLLTLSSGNSGYMEQSVVASLQTKKSAKGASYSFTDWLGNSFTVFIVNFDPKPTFIGSLWTYTLELRVTAMTTLLGSAYSGS